MKPLNFILLIFSVACGGSNFKKVEVLEEFRVLSAVTSTPEVAPGAAVNLQLFVSDVKGGPRVIPGTTVSCIDPGISYGASVNCDHDPFAVADTYDVDTTGLTLYTGLAPAILSVTVPAGIFTGRSVKDQSNGVGYIVIFNFDVDGKKVSAFKRIIATTRTGAELNSNPTGSSILLNGVAITTTPNKNDKLKMTSSSPEAYTFINTDGNSETRTEEYQVAWYVSTGKFDKPKSDVDETVKYLGNTASAPSVLVGIVRDDRGGVDIIRKTFP